MHVIVKPQNCSAYDMQMAIVDQMNRGEQMCRYYGYYSNKTRGMRKKAGADDAVPALMEPVLTSRAMPKHWARLIQKVYHVDPLVCPKCQGTMKIISFIEESDVIRIIFVHLNLWDLRNRCLSSELSPKLNLDIVPASLINK